MVASRTPSRPRPPSTPRANHVGRWAAVHRVNAKRTVGKAERLCARRLKTLEVRTLAHFVTTCRTVDLAEAARRFDVAVSAASSATLSKTSPSRSNSQCASLSRSRGAGAVNETLSEVTPRPQPRRKQREIAPNGDPRIGIRKILILLMKSQQEGVPHCVEPGPLPGVKFFCILNRLR